MALLEARPYRPFKSSEEYLEAMREDLAEWLNTLYPELTINADNFMERLDTGVALCKHANNVRQSAADYLARRQARNKSLTRSVTSGAAGPILAMGNIHYLAAAKSGTFFARDNVSNFITWCRKCLKIIECLLFETDDLIMRKNEKHVILCLLEVARRGAKFGMLAPMLIQMERQIDREIAADNKANGIGCGTQTDNPRVITENVATETNPFDDTDSDNDDENDHNTANGDDDGPLLVYGPQPQIITNDLKSLDEMVRDLVEKCTCPSQFPMVRVSEGKYRIGDTKVLIFVRILRSHVMVRVGGGWDTLSHYLDKHDPCRCRSQHRTAISARLIPRSSSAVNTNGQIYIGGGGIELHKTQVIFERSPPATRKIIHHFNGQNYTNNTCNSSSSGNGSNQSTLPLNSRSPTPQQKFINKTEMCNISNADTITVQELPSAVEQIATLKVHATSLPPKPITIQHLDEDLLVLENSGCIDQTNEVSSTVMSSTPVDTIVIANSNGVSGGAVNNTIVAVNAGNSNNNNKFENISDNGSEISDEGYRSLGLIQSNVPKRESLHSHASIDDAENNARHDQTSSDSPLSPTEEVATTVSRESPVAETDLRDHKPQQHDYCIQQCNKLKQRLKDEPEDDAEIGPKSLPAILNPDLAVNQSFQQSGVYITDDNIMLDVASATGLRRTDFASKIFGSRFSGGNNSNIIDQSDGRRDLQRDNPSRQPTILSVDGAGKQNAIIPHKKTATLPSNNPLQRKHSIDSNSVAATGSLQDIHSRMDGATFSRQKPIYRSVRKPTMATEMRTAITKNSTKGLVGREMNNTNTWNGRSMSGAAFRKRPTLNNETFTGRLNNPTSAFERNNKIRSSQTLYDSNGRRVRCNGTPNSSANTSPVKNNHNSSSNSSPLAQQLLEAANSAKNDAQILEKMKTLLMRYSSGTGSGNNNNNTNNPNTSRQFKKAAIYEDFTTAWVNSNGNLERASSCSPPTAKPHSKRSSIGSSNDSNHSRDMSSVIISPRRDRGVSKIPGPVRQHTELY